ncbi:MAG: hypothetical protein A2X82_06940 [Geobacteraceae bacterium GWC2_55_20]|nr:MAG: hypothetical protein A2X82_06940 [Geobacteraceae bacterium GWC2_55_20]HCE68366.1 hypothetical protein [Geobacter sp.]
MNMTEDTLDQLHQLSVKRISEILETGADLRLENSDKHYKGIIADDRNSIKFESRAPLQCGQIYESKGCQYFVTGITSKAGMQVADVAPVVGTAAIFRKHLAQNPTNSVTHLRPEGLNLPILKREGNEITVPRFGAAAAGKVLKTAGMDLEVINARIAGPLAVLTVRNYQPESRSLPNRTYQHAPMASVAPARYAFGGY